MNLLNQIFGKGDEGPSTATNVKANFDFTSEFEEVLLDAFGCLCIVKDEVGVQVQGPASQVRALKGVGFGDPACSALQRIESVPFVAMSPVESGHRCDKTGCLGREFSTEFLEQTEPSVGGERNL